MKKLFNIIALTAAFAAGVFSVSSCKEFLDEAPNSGQDKEYIFEDYLRSQRYLDGIYNYMLHHHIGGDKFGGVLLQRHIGIGGGLHRIGGAARGARPTRLPCLTTPARRRA